MRPVTPDRLVAHLTELILALVDPTGWVRVGLDGPDAAHPERLADALVAPLRAAGHAAVRVIAADQLRPASRRYERGRTDPDSYSDDWLDEEGLRREVLDPLSPGGTGRVRPVRWDARTDRASRSGFDELKPGSVLLLSGPLLLGRGLPLDLTVHLDLTPAALARRTPEAQAWTLPAFARYTAEVAPATWADVVVRYDDPRHPALA